MKLTTVPGVSVNLFVAAALELVTFELTVTSSSSKSDLEIELKSTLDTLLDRSYSSLLAIEDVSDRLGPS
jgi:hypothetical protein